MKGLQYINIKLMLCYHFRMSTWKAVLMAPGMRDATSHVHMAEVFSVPITTSYQTVGLTPVETRLEQLIVRKYMLLYRENGSMHIHSLGSGVLVMITSYPDIMVHVVSSISNSSLPQHVINATTCNYCSNLFI